ncbi:MAG: hydantoinase/oxoprolinase family protein, partial [Deltaproteobacteria bacterium]|nr:hydantoinase/oxoprolinase family protein [Deltaproteobacteria bacterium]
GGLLRMGPQSASSKPGPACYGLGGQEPTCTDADLVLGYLDPDFFAGGRMKLDLEAAGRAIEEKVGRPLGFDLTRAAAGMYDVINVNMAAAVREVAVQHGQDPRDFPLVVAGGAGPNHACKIALELEIPLLLVPRESSIFCAAGMLMSDLQHDFVRSYPVVLAEADPRRLAAVFEEMRAEGRKLLQEEGLRPDKIRFIHSLDLRYVRQYHEVTVEVPAEEIERCDFAAMTARFHPAHFQLYGYELKEEKTPVELINMRLRAVGLTDKPGFFEQDYAGPEASAALKGRRPVYLPNEGQYFKTPVFDAFALSFGNQIAGPAILEQVNTTIFVTPEYKVLVDRFGSYTLYLPSVEDEVKARILP